MPKTLDALANLEIITSQSLNLAVLQMLVLWKIKRDVNAMMDFSGAMTDSLACLHALRTPGQQLFEIRKMSVNVKLEEILMSLN